MNGATERDKLTQGWKIRGEAGMTETMKAQETADGTEAVKVQETAGRTEAVKAQETADGTEEAKTQGQANAAEAGKEIAREKGEQLVNEMRLCFLSRGENEGLARIAVAGFIACMDPTLDILDDIRTAVSEAVTNAIIHGYQGKTDGIVYLSAFLYEREAQGALLRVDVEDTGIGIENVKKAMEPLYSTSPDRERAGMGFAFMAAFTDRLEVQSKPRLGTCVSMWKELTPPEGSCDEE